MTESGHEGLVGGIAVVGMAGRFPGAESIEEFWRGLTRGAESVTFLTDAELGAAGVSRGDLEDPDYVKARGLLKAPDLFDAAFFGIGQREADLMDPQHRLFLESCCHALDHAAINPQAFPGLIGVWGGSSTGMTSNKYFLSNLHRRPGVLQAEDMLPAMLGNENDYLTSRVSYKLNLRGPCVNVQTACSTSLVAVVQACQSLLAWQCDAALAGGVSVSYPQHEGYRYVEGGIGSPDGRCRPFDAHAQGTVFSNGVGVVVLRRLEDAVADRQTIYAVIRGSALNNDGSSKVSFAAPSVDGQAEVIAMAQAAAGVEPDTIDYIEAHGTGTPLGDPIEVSALTKAFRAGGAEGTGYCALGSVKSNIGHVDAAAGIAGLIKTTLAVYHAQIPPTLHFRAPNPKCDLEHSPFFVNAQLREWPRHGRPRRAGVSSFGIGGTNAHVVLEEAPASLRRAETADSADTLLLVSARTKTALDAAAANLASHLAGHSDVNMADAAHTLRVGRQEFAERRAYVCHGRHDAIAALESGSPKRVISGVAEPGTRAVAFMFPGGGAQHVNMGRDLLSAAPVFREELDRCLDVIGREHDIRTALLPADERVDAAAALLERPSLGLPALFAVQYALARQWMAWGVQPSALIGHSMGEYTAACLAGVMSLEDALALVLLRGRLFETLPPGGMLGVPLPESDVQAKLGDALAIAAVNAPSSCVVSGPIDALAEFTRLMDAEGVECRRLHIVVAAHSPMLDPILDEFERFSRSIALHAPTIPIVSNSTGSWLTADEARAPGYWAHHLRHTVRFCDGLSVLLAEPNRVLLEVGPGQALSGFAKQHPERRPSQIVQASMRQAREAVSDWSVLQQAVGRLWTVGVSLDWAAYDAGCDLRRIPLPGYPFERKRHLIEPHDAPTGHPMSAQIQPITTAEPTHDRHARPMPRSRADRILERLTQLLHTLSGLAVADIDPKASFLEMGFDSLFLTQASLRFKSEFKVRITLRQLFEDAPSLEALTAYIDRELPADALPAPPEETAAPPTAPAPATGTTTLVSRDTSTSTAPRGAVEQIVQQQLQLMAEQLRLLGGAPAAPAERVTAVPAARPADTATAREAKPHPAFKPIDRSAGELSPEQRAAFETWTARYTRRTAGSKKLAADSRTVLADPRSVMGFNRLWKEMVYQIVTTRSEGSKIWDVDGNEYVDLVGGYGSLLFGHRASFVVDAVQRQLSEGFEIGPMPALAAEVAGLVRDLTGMERVGFANTGSEAVLAATRLARTVTGRDKIAVFEGSYHGLFDEVLSRPLVANGEVRSVPAVPGIPETAVSQVLLLEYGNPESIDIIRAHESEIAAILVEPVQSRRLDLQPREFLASLRRLADAIGAALIFDEVITGFRVHPGGAQAHFGVRADLASYGKVVGGGLPIGIVAGAAKYMDAFDGGAWQYGDGSFPEAGVTYFAGTFVRHPLALSASKAVLTRLKADGPTLQSTLADRVARLAEDCRAIVRKHGAPFVVTQFSSMMSLNFPHDQKWAVLLFYLMRERGIHIWEGRPSFFGTAHTEADYAAILEALDESLAELRAAHFFESPSDDDVIVPLTEGQLEIWLGAQMGEASSRAFNEGVAVELRGPLAAPSLRWALSQVVARHESLRMVVSAEPLGFRRLAAFDVPMTVRDLQNLDGAARESALEEILRSCDTESFDLSRGPLVRATLAVMAPDRHVLLLAAHHLVCDGWSFNVVLRDLGALYSANVERSPLSLDAPLQVSQFNVDAEARKGTDAAKETEAFWVGQFRTIPAPLDLPSDRPRLPARSSRGARLGVTYGADLTSALKALGKEQRSTFFTIMLAGFDVLLSRLTGQSDFVVGIPAAAQATLDRDLVAHCVNFLPLRRTVDPSSTFAGHLAGLKRQWLDAGDHQDFTSGSLLAKLRLRRDPARDPLVSVSFTTEPAVGEGTRFAQLGVSSIPVPRAAVKRDLHVNAMEIDGTLFVEADFDTDLFDSSTIARWLHMYERLLHAVAATPDLPIRDIALLDATEQDTMLAKWNATETPYPADALLHVLIESQALRTPDAVAVECDGQSLTYAELDRHANQLAHRLRKLGVGPDVLAGVCLERSTALMVTLCAILKAGGAYVPLDPDYPVERLAFMVADAGAPVLVTTRGLAARLPVTQATTLVIDDEWKSLATEPVTKPVERATPDGLAYMIYTSGSTGRPKGAPNTHRGICNQLFWMRDQYAVGTGDVILQKTPTSFDVSVWELFLPLMTGARMVLATPGGHRDPAYLVDLIDRRRVTMMHFVPAMLRVFLDQPDLERCRTLRHVICSGEAFPADLRDAFFRRLSCGLHNLYGPTEAAVHVTYWDCRQASNTPIVPIGRPVANTQIYVLDDQLRPTPVGVPGELYIGGVQVGRGYHKRPELTAERFIRDPFAPGATARVYKTGDLCRFLADGAIEYLGRLDDQIKLRGFRIELGEVEAVLQSHAGVKQCAAAVREDAAGDKFLVGYLVPTSGAEAATSELREFLKTRLPDYMVPSIFVAMAALPLTPSGKIDRTALPAPRPEDHRRNEDAVLHTDTERALAAIWLDFLRVDRVGRHDDFFGGGGDSLLATRAAMRIQEVFGVTLSLAQFFQTPTIAGMAAEIDAYIGDSADRAAPVIARSARLRVRRDELVRS